MKTISVFNVVLTLTLIWFVAAPASATENKLASPSRILITFEDDSANKSSGPGRYYRHRPRYRISAIARSDAKAIAAEYKLVAVDDWPIKSLNVYCVVYESSASEPLAALINRLDADPRVESVQALQSFQSMTSPGADYNDFYAGLQHGLRSMNILEAHRFARGAGVKVAVIDTSIDRHHEDLSSDHIRVRNFVSGGQGLNATEHGTAVVSVIGANPNNQKGIVGVAPGAEVIALSACWSEHDLTTAHCDSFTLAKAMDYLIQSPPDVLNLSIAGPHDALLGRLIAVAQQNGTVIVAAQPRGSENRNVYPASFPGVIAIASAPGAKESPIEHARPLNGLLAPGEQIMVALPDDLYDFRSGSSLATANASGVIALLLEHSPELDSQRIVEILRQSQTENSSGSGGINACRALAKIGVALSCQ